MSVALEEIQGQSQALQELAQAYLAGGQVLQFKAFPASQPLVLTGMGASYHAAQNAALQMASYGVAATALQASDLLYYGAATLSHAPALVYISQSGESAEIAPILSALSHDCLLVGVTNQPDSLLARKARLVLPLYGGVETTIASKTYVNSLALLWLLARHLGSRWTGDERQQLADVADRAAGLLTNASGIADHWINALGTGGRLLFLGHGPHAVTARHAAMTLAEVAKVMPWQSSVGAYRHGLIEATHSDMAVVMFVGNGPGYESGMGLASELQGYGARVFLVENGKLRPATDAAPQADTVDEFLAPILNVIPPQLFALAVAEARGVQEGFRFIRKVVDRL